MRAAGIALAALALTLVACADQVAGAPIGTGQTVDPTATSGGVGTGSVAPTTTTTDPTPSIPGFPQAADGTDVAACFDGTCEVELRAPQTIPLDPATGIVSLTLHRVDEVDGAQLSGTTTDGGTVSVNVYAEPGGTATAVVNGFTIVALATVNGRAVLRMSPP